MSFSEIMRELWKSASGKIGIVLLVLLSVTSVVVMVTYPADFGTAVWGNPSLWADNPKSAPPAWVNILTKTRQPPHRIFRLDKPTSVESTARATEQVFSAPFAYRADVAPSFVSVSLSDITFDARPPIMTGTLVRPDGGKIMLFREVASAPRRGEERPYTRYTDEPFRVLVSSDARVVDQLQQLFAEKYNLRVDRDAFDQNFEAALFGTPTEDGTIAPLHGDYSIEVSVLTASKDDTVGSVKAVVGGTVFGAMGTDALGRDLALGLLFGLPVALLIGISTSVVSTFLGMSLGLLSGYLGGKTDLIIQRASDIVANVPVLPLLIFLVFIGGSQLWLILLVLVAFSWPGLTIMVRTMVLQLASGQEVEASRALGAGKFRIIFRHILPHVASYVLAQLVFFAPSAILSEAGLSFLGLGDPSIPTWGQILEYGFRTGAVFLGYWWWIVPPGLMIVLTAVTFMFLALGLEPVVDPRLRGRRLWRY